MVKGIKMIIQNSGATTQAPHSDKPVSNDAPKIITDSAKAPVAQVAHELSSQSLKSAVDSVNRALQQSSSQSLQISVDSATKRQIVKLMDIQTGEMIRQIPSKEMLAIAQSIDQFLQNGQLLSEKA
jgi:flagellar protein FlaG